jgi:ADP-ribose pyrophosphatase YjhB (NUDIX family)
VSAGAEGERRFCRLSAKKSVAEGYWNVPPDGLCLSSFLILSPERRPDLVLLGRVDPDAPWFSIAALDDRRRKQFASGWMLPSCHLLYFEAPVTAARRVLAEQLGLREVALEPPTIVSETYPSARNADERQHWDLDFLFRGRLASETPPRHSAWSELRFLDPSRTARSEFVRAHEDILEMAGYRVGK